MKVKFSAIIGIKEAIAAVQSGGYALQYVLSIVTCSRVSRWSFPSK